MNSLKQTEQTVEMEVPQAVGNALKAFKNDNPIAYNFIVYELAGILKLAFAMPGESQDTNWMNGRRFVGLQIERIVTAPMDEVTPELPRARTISEQRRRRGAS